MMCTTIMYFLVSSIDYDMWFTWRIRLCYHITVTDYTFFYI